MKILSSLVIIQTALVLLLFVKLGAIEDRLDVRSDHDEPTTLNESAVTSDPLNPPPTAQEKLDGKQLRRIVREELLAVLSHELASKIQAGDEEIPAYDRAEMQYQRELVIQELEYLKQQQNVTSVELDKLMGDIAQLDPESRTELLRMLNQAMNRGEIKGKL